MGRNRNCPTTLLEVSGREFEKVKCILLLVLDHRQTDRQTDRQSERERETGGETKRQAYGQKLLRQTTVLVYFIKISEME
jgi:hypothetical protein